VQADARKSQHRLLVVIHHQPLEPARLAVAGVQAAVAGVAVVQVAHQAVDACMGRVFQQVPGQLAVVRPFAGLGQLGPHEQQFFAGVRVHPRIQGAQVGQLLPAVAGHFAQQ